MKDNSAVYRYLEFFKHFEKQEIVENEYYYNRTRHTLTHYPKHQKIYNNVIKVEISHLYPFIIYHMMKGNLNLKCSIDYINLYENIIHFPGAYTGPKFEKQMLNMIYGMQEHKDNEIKFNFNLKNAVSTHMNAFFRSQNIFSNESGLICYDIDTFYFSRPVSEYLLERFLKFFEDAVEIKMIDMFVYMGPKRFIEINNGKIEHVKGIKG